MRKKIIKIGGILLLLLVGIVIAAPFLLEAKIGDLIKNNVNNNVNATLDFSEADLSLIRSFPSAAVRLTNVALVNKSPFEGDTLFAAKKVELKMGIAQLFNTESEPIAIKKLLVDGAIVNITVDEDENASYDIGKETTDAASAETETSGGFQLNLQQYELSNAAISYNDRAAGIQFNLVELQHKGSGDLSLQTSELETTTSALVTFGMDSTVYLNRNKVQLDALIGVDLTQDKYSFLKNEAIVNQLPLVFDGFVKLNNSSQEVDVSFKTPSSDFKNFLAVIPEAYSKNIENVKTTGNFEVGGRFYGIVDETHIPKFDIAINSTNASFKYPDLPKSVQNVNIDTKINNRTGIVEDTYVDIDTLTFTIDKDRFNMTAHLKELMGNTKVNAHVDGTMHLANLAQAYPVPDGLDLKGLLEANITTAFDMASVENHNYKNTKTTGALNLKDFEYRSDEVAKPIALQTTAITFNPETVTLDQLSGTTGETDFNATGSIENLLGFLFNDEQVEGNFDLNSNTFALNDFMVPDQEDATDGGTPKDSGSETPGATEKIKIPSFLDATINANATKVLYDNLVLKDVKGQLRIKDEKAVLSNMTSSLFDGKIAFNGEVSTKNEVPTFAMNLGLDKLEIGETFKSLELFKVLAPVASILQGKLDSDIQLSGNLTNDFSPDLLSLSGNILANIFAREIDAEKTPVLNALDNKLDFIDLKRLNLDQLKTKLTFEDGIVNVKPFTIAYKDIAINIDGGHTFDQKLDYTATMEVPAKYLGSQVNDLIAKIDDSSLKGMTIPVKANIGGVYNSPAVTTDLSSGIKSLTVQLIEVQKQKLVNQGKDKAKDLIGDILHRNSTDTTQTKNGSDNGVKEVLGGILGEQKKKDSVTASDAPPENGEDVVKEKAKNILGGFLGGKKKKDSSKSEEKEKQ